MNILEKIDALFETLYSSFIKQKQAIARNYIIQDSITCKCKGLAIPVYNTTNKYLCLRCGSRFANARHHVTSNIQSHDGITQITYDKVVEQLRAETSNF